MSFGIWIELGEVVHALLGRKVSPESAEVNLSSGAALPLFSKKEVSDNFHVLDSYTAKMSFSRSFTSAWCHSQIMVSYFHF